MIPVDLRTVRLVLDQPRQADVDDIAQYCTDPLFERYMVTPWPYERRHAEYFVDDYVPGGWVADREYTWAIRLAGGAPLLGVVGWRRDRSDLGFWMGAPHRGAGYMTEAVGAAIGWLFAEVGVDLIAWECVAGNLASASVARANGFHFEGNAPPPSSAAMADAHRRGTAYCFATMTALCRKGGRDDPDRRDPRGPVRPRRHPVRAREAVAAGITAHRATLGGPLAAADAAAEAARWHDLEEHHYHRYLRGELDYPGQRHARARDFVAPFGIELDDQQAEDWFWTYFVEYQRAWVLHRDAAGCLDVLESRGIRLGIITNGELEFQSRKIRALDLDSRLEHVIASGEVGAAKPDPEIFLAACAAFEVSPAEACYVGDRLHTDAVGAASAGLLGVWLDRRGSGDGCRARRGRRVGSAGDPDARRLPALVA